MYSLTTRHILDNRQSRLNADHIHTPAKPLYDQKYYTPWVFLADDDVGFFLFLATNLHCVSTILMKKTRPFSYLHDERGGKNGVFVVSDDITVSNHPARSVDKETIIDVRKVNRYLLGAQNQRQYTVDKIIVKLDGTHFEFTFEFTFHMWTTVYQGTAQQSAKIPSAEAHFPFRKTAKTHFVCWYIRTRTTIY